MVSRGNNGLREAPFDTIQKAPTTNVDEYHPTATDYPWSRYGWRSLLFQRYCGLEAHNWGGDANGVLDELPDLAFPPEFPSQRRRLRYDLRL